MATPHVAGGGAAWERGALQSKPYGVYPASEAALQRGVKGSCVPKLRGPF